MSLSAILLLLLSAAVHAAWNVSGKRQQASAAFLLAANTLGCLLLAPAVVLYGGALANFPGQVWGALALTGLCQAAYYAALAGAYRSGDLSVAYPLARALPALFVAGITRLWGLGRPPGALALAGMLLVAAGCLVLPLPRFAEFRWRNYWNRTCLLALAAACATTGYSLIDSQALALLRPAVAGSVSGPAVTALYALLEGLSTSIWLALWVLAIPAERGTLLRMDRQTVMRTARMGAGIYLAYTLVLVAMGFVTNVSYVVAFRQLSIPLGALMGMTLLGEARPFPRLVGIAVTFAGLVLVGIG